MMRRGEMEGKGGCWRAGRERPTERDHLNRGRWRGVERDRKKEKTEGGSGREREREREREGKRKGRRKIGREIYPKRGEGSEGNERKVEKKVMRLNMIRKQ